MKLALPPPRPVPERSTRSGREDDAGKAYLERLERSAGSQLAIELAAAGPDTVGDRAAWQHAEEACAELGRSVEAFLPAEKVVASARRAVMRDRPRRS